MQKNRYCSFIKAYLRVAKGFFHPESVISPSVKNIFLCSTNS